MNSPLITAIENEIARSMAPRPARRIVIRRRNPRGLQILLEQVAAETVPAEVIMATGTRGTAEIARARWLFMVLAIDLTNKARFEIARFLHMDHSSVAHGTERARAILAESDEHAFCRAYERIAALWT